MMTNRKVKGHKHVVKHSSQIYSPSFSFLSICIIIVTLIIVACAYTHEDYYSLEARTN